MHLSRHPHAVAGRGRGPPLAQPLQTILAVRAAFSRIVLEARENRWHARRKAGGAMAAVFCFVFLPALASIGLMSAVARGQMSFGTAFATLCFSIMASGLFVGMYKLAHQWEHEDDPR